MSSSPNLIQVGAVFDGAQFNTAMNGTADATKQALAKIELAFDELQRKTAARIAEIEEKLAEMSAAHVEHAGKSSEAIHAMGLSMEATGVNINRHMRGIISQVPILSAAFETLFPVFALTAGIEILKHVGEKLSELISDTFIFTESQKEEDKALKSVNSQLAGNVERIKQLGRETLISAARTAEARDKLKLAFALEDIGGDPAKIKAKLDPLRDELTKLQNVFAGANRFAVPDALKELGFGEETPGARVQAAQKKVAELTTEVTRLESALRLAEATQAHFNQTIKQDDANQAKETTLAQIEATEKTSEAQLAIAKAKFAELRELAKVNSEQIEAIEKGFEDRDYQIKQAGLNKKLALAEKDPEKNASSIIAIQGQIRALAETHEAALTRIKMEGIAGRKKAEEQQTTELAKQNDQIMADAKAENDEILRGLDEQRGAFDIAYKDEIEAAKQASEIKIQLIEQDYEKGKISQQREIALVAQEKDLELAIERNVQRLRWALWDGDVKKQAEIQAALRKNYAQASLISTKAVTDGLKAQEQQYRQFFSQIGSALSSNVQDVLKGNESIAQGFQKMYQSLIGGLIDFVSKKAEKKAEEWLIEEIFGKKKAAANVAQATSNVGVAAAEALASVPWPFNIAAAAETEGVGAGFESQAAVAFFAQGTNFVPQDGLAYLHKGEKVIPASQQGPGYKGGGGLTIVVNHSVSAVDAESFQGHIRKHGNMIGQEVARILKRKGYKG